MEFISLVGQNINRFSVSVKRREKYVQLYDCVFSGVPLAHLE